MSLPRWYLEVPENHRLPTFNYDDQYNSLTYEVPAASAPAVAQAITTRSSSPVPAASTTVSPTPTADDMAEEEDEIDMSLTHRLFEYSNISFDGRQRSRQ